MQPADKSSAPSDAAASPAASGEEMAAPKSRLSLEQLVLLFPILKARPPRILDKGIVGRALETQLGALYTRSSILNALKRATTSVRYLEALLEGAPIHDLTGSVVGAVSAAHAARARDQLAAITSTRRPPRSSATLRRLCERFPNLFNLEEPQPLPPGTYKFLLNQLAGECSPNDLADALKIYYRARQAHGQKPEVIAAGRENSASAPQAVTNTLPGPTKRELAFKDLKVRYSACFNATPPRPLAQSVLPALEGELRAEFSGGSLRRVLRKHTISRAYLQVLVSGAPRYNLAGEVDGFVSEAEAHEARSLLADRLYSAESVLRMRNGDPLGPRGRAELLSALEGGNLSVHEFARRYKVPTDTLAAQRRFALRERQLERHAQAKLVDQYASSGLSELMFCTIARVKLKALREAIEAVENVEEERITAALTASIAAQKHEPLNLHDSSEPAVRQLQPQEPPKIEVRRRRRIVVPERTYAPPTHRG